MKEQKSPKQQDMTFEEDGLKISVRLIQAMGIQEFMGDAQKISLVMPVSLALLRPSWQIIQEEELKQIMMNDHPLSQAIEKIPGIEKISIASDSILVVKKEQTSWNEIIAPLVATLFNHQRSVRKAERLIAKLEMI